MRAKIKNLNSLDVPDLGVFMPAGDFCISIRVIAEPPMSLEKNFLTFRFAIRHG
jgi:hypothetical protein